HHLAELNIGRLTAPTDDPRVAYRRERDSVARFAGMILGSLCAACSLWIGSGPALAENQRLPDETYDEIFRLHLAGVANENCKGLAASASDMDARWAANTRNTRNATGLPYPDIAVIYE